MSTSASSPPNCPETIPLSGIPWKAGDPPKAVFQTFVPKVIHESDVKTAVPSGPIVTAGSLLPLSNTSAVFEKAVAEAVRDGVAAPTDETSNESATAKPISPINLYPMTTPPPGGSAKGNAQQIHFPKEDPNEIRVIGTETGLPIRILSGTAL